MNDSGMPAHWWKSGRWKNREAKQKKYNFSISLGILWDYPSPFSNNFKRAWNKAKNVFKWITQNCGLRSFFGLIQGSIHATTMSSMSNHVSLHSHLALWCFVHPVRKKGPIAFQEQKGNASFPNGASAEQHVAIVRLARVGSTFRRGPRFGVSENYGIPSGNLLHSYWKWPFIVSFPIKNGHFQ